MKPRTQPDRDERIRLSLEWLERYRPLVDDWTAFRAALDGPPPLDLLALPRSGGRDVLAASLASRGLGAVPLPGSPHHLRVSGASGGGALPEVQLGLAFPQGVSSAHPPLALAPRAGEWIADLCAAPGGKSVLLGMLAERAGLLVANEPNAGRGGVLLQSLARVGESRAVVVQHDAQGFPAQQPYDAILLDAPCTGEGTFRVASPRYELRGADGLAATAALQARLLTRALDLLAPGGRLAYSTCAYSPEENEAVLDRVLAQRGDTELVPLPPATPGLPGLDEWEGRRLRPTLAHTRRILPHHNGSWGFFVALLRKDPHATKIARPRVRPGSAPTALAEEPELRALVEDYFATLFGVAPESFADHVVVRRGRDAWLAPRDAGLLDSTRFRFLAPGLRTLHRIGDGYQPTNAILRALGPAISRSVVDLALDEACAALLESPSAPPLVPLDAARQSAAWATIAGAREQATVAVRVGGVVVGKGRLSARGLVLDIPSGWR